MSLMSLSRNDFRRSVPIGGRLEALEVIEVEGNAGRRTKFDRIFVLTFVTFSFYCIGGIRRRSRVFLPSSSTTCIPASLIERMCLINCYTHRPPSDTWILFKSEGLGEGRLLQLKILIYTFST